MNALARDRTVFTPLDREGTLTVLLRRAASFSLLFLASIAGFGLAPLWVPLAALADRLLPDRRCALRCGAFLCWLLACEWVGLLAAAGNALVRVASRDAGSEREWNRLYALQSTWAGWLLRGAMRIFGFTIEVTGCEALDAGPMLLLMRHASMADTLLAAVFVSGGHGVRLRYVMKHELLWDPCLDVVGNRLPNYFVRRGSDDPEREISGVVGLLEDLGEREGVLIYPEGTRFSRRKRERVLAKLRKLGNAPLLARAEALRHILPPRLSGTLALLERNPGLDVVIGAHVGFEGAATLPALWRGALRDARVHLHFWRVPYRELPSDRAALTDWLFDQWLRVDRWVGSEAARTEARS